MRQYWFFLENDDSGEQQEVKGPFSTESEAKEEAKYALDNWDLGDGNWVASIGITTNGDISTLDVIDYVYADNFNYNSPQGGLEEVKKNNRFYKNKENMGHRIRMSESELRRLVAENIKKMLNEIGNTPKGQYMLGRLAGRKAYRDNDLEGAINVNMHAFNQSKTKDSKGHGVLSNDFKKGVANEKEKITSKSSTTADSVNESHLKKIVAESVKKVLRENNNEIQFELNTICEKMKSEYPVDESNAKKL